MKTYLIFIALLAGVSISCHQSTSPSPVVGPYLGEMTGRVVPLDVNGDSLPSLLTGTIFGLRGTNLVTTTDSTGQYTLKNVPAGIYSVYMAKQGFDTIGWDYYHFSGAGVDFLNPMNITRMPSDTMVLDYAVIRDSSINGIHQNALFFGGHISSNKLQRFQVAATVDSATKAGGGLNLFVQNGKFSGAFFQVADPTLPISYEVDSLTSGRKIFVCAELLPLTGYGEVSGYVTRDYSNTLEITVP